ncbi:hypothetical protein AMS68_005021 [Peltaster fructicola]|uniref:Proline dehydrogenase n=1 Tax=Peltaster fructicola TaxID=286661 RepID=A0A6H0XXP7_9PEZI|nr:hypothetical protein AMS68_005021 [Peltaster fructicola]
MASLPRAFAPLQRSSGAKTLSKLRGDLTQAECRRLIHSSKQREVSASPFAADYRHREQSLQKKVSGLASLPVSQILRTYLITSISSSPALLDASSSLLRRLIDSDNSLASLDNPVLRAVLWETFYKQFCAGETAEQISSSCEALRQQGYAGVILEYAREVLKDADGCEAEDVLAWHTGMLKSIQLAAPGDFLGLKWSGMGAAALKRLAARQDPSPAMHDAMVSVCEAASAKSIALLPSAEETSTLQGYFAWSLMMQRLFNRAGKSVVYNTYQAYLRQIPETLGKHLEVAKQDGFTLGVKMVRGAYLSSEERSLLQPSIEATHAAYDGISAALIHRKYNDVLQSSGSSAFPDVNVVLATHNAESVRKAREARQRQADQDQELTPLCFAQLQGMADEVSCSLLAAADRDHSQAIVEKVYKCTTWGTMTECLNYLLRRAAENKDAASRTADSRRAMQAELFRRVREVFSIKASQ